MVKKALKWMFYLWFLGVAHRVQMVHQPADAGGSEDQ